MRKIAFLMVAALVTLTGCSNLVVHKVSVDQRLANRDRHVDGFRYYLSRPYVLVLEPIPLTSTKVLVSLKENGEFNYLDGINAGKTSSLDALRRENAGSPIVTAIKPEEWARMRSVMQTPTQSEDVVPAQHIASQNIIIGDQGSGVFAAGDPSTTPEKPDTPKPTTPPVPSTRKSAQLNGSIQIVFLPDMDEQYAIRSKNCFSKSEFSLQFKNGWELTDVSGNHDSTPVAIELFKTIDTAIDVAKSLSTAAVGKVPTPSGGAKDTGSAQDRKATNHYYLTKTTMLKPGIYRLNKPWEMEGELPTGCGFLTKLGLETFTTVELVPVTQAVQLEEIKGTVKSKEVKDVNKLTLTITLEDNKTERTFKVGKNTPITIDGTPLSATTKFGKDMILQFARITDGSSVTVTAQGDNAVRIVVTKKAGN